MNKQKKILCLYATRAMDSNLFMASTIFNGLQQTGWKTDIVFAAPADIIRSFQDQYEHYFHESYILKMPDCACKKFFQSEKARVLYSYITHFILDPICRPYSKRKLRCLLEDRKYDSILCFCPPPVSGFLGIDVKTMKQFSQTPIIQFWTDPLSLGRCDSIEDIPRSRFLHKILEHRILKKADRAVFCYPLLCEMEQKLYPDLSSRMTWSDISYTEHKYDDGKKVNNPRIRIGLFGAYQQRVRNIFPILNVIKELPDYQFVIRGDSDLTIDTSTYSNLDLKPGRIPLKEVEILESSCDILLSLSGKSGITQPPGKTFYYANYNKPIIFIADGAHSDFSKKYFSGFEGRYIVCDNEAYSIKAAILEAVKQLPHFELKIPQRMEPSTIAKKIFDNI